jgi:hypothetical protein
MAAVVYRFHDDPMTNETTSDLATQMRELGFVTMEV